MTVLGDIGLLADRNGSNTVFSQEVYFLLCA